MYVVDACMMGPLIISDEEADLHQALPTLLARSAVVVPSNWHLEVANLGRMSVRRKRLTASELRDALEQIAQFTVVIDDSTTRQAWNRTLDLSERYDLTAYDAAYLELALRRGLPLLTRDGALRRAAADNNIELP